MNKDEIKAKIISLYEECEALQQKVNANKSTINSYLQKFVVGNQIGDGVYSNDPTRGYDINLSGNKADYEEAMSLINRDIDDIDLIISKHNELKDLMSQAPMDNELLEIGYKALAMIEKMYQEREERVAILNRIKQIYSILEQQEEEMKHQQNNENLDYGGSSSGGDYSDSTSGGLPTSEDTTGDSSTTNAPPTTTPPATSEETFSTGDYQAALNFNLTNSDMSVAKSNLDAHADNVKSLLANVVVNGEVIGGDVYGVSGSASTSDVGFNFGALQLACDAVSADVSAISAYITQMKNKIETNKASIQSITAEMNRTETIETVDEKGNPVTYEHKIHSGSEIAAYQAQIDAMNAENTQLEADITSYTNQMKEKKEVFNKLINFRNAYNQAYNGMMNTFAANDILNALAGAGESNSLLGMSLTDGQKQDLFNNLGTNLMNNQNNLSLVTGEDFNMMKGEYPLGAYQYLLGACSILGNSQNSFQDNLKLFGDFRQSIANSLQYNDPSMNGETGNNTNTQNSNQTSGDQESDSKANTTATGRPISTKVLDPAVEQFMTSNSGRIVAMSKEMKQSLGLSMDALISIPKGYNTGEEYPFLVWLAGTGTAGGDVNNLKTSTFVKNVVNGQYTLDGAIMYVPCGWGSGSSEANNSTYDGGKLSKDLPKVINGLNVDKNHISGMGISIGAFALAYLVDAHPNLFSSVAMCGGGFEGPFRNVTVEKAIQNSPGTSFIWYNANNDETSGGVRTNALKHHQALLNAGMNSVYYEVGGDIWHVEACDRFVTDAMVNDLINIEKGAKYTVPNGIQHISATDAYKASVSHGSQGNKWYIPLSSGEKKAGGYTTLEHHEVATADPLPKEKILPDLFLNIKGAIPDLSTIVAANDILKNVPTPTPTVATPTASEEVKTDATGSVSTTGDNSGTDPRYLKGDFIVYSQMGSKNSDGTFVWYGWDNIFNKKEQSGEYTNVKWGKDIFTSGCSVASSAMVVSNLTHQNVTPDYVKTLYHNVTANNGYGFAHDVFDKYGLDYASGISVRKKDENGVYYYDNVLKNGGAIINTVNEGGHYLAILGVDDSGSTKKYFVADPYQTSPGVWMSVDSPEFSPIKNGYHESSMVIAPPGMDINQALAAPGTTTTPRQVVVGHKYAADTQKL